jgi:hypothetical protein
MNYIKRLIRYIYWEYAHDGDPWQTRLVIYHLKNIVASVPEALPKKDVSSRFMFAQIEEKMNNQNHVSLNGFADIKIGGIIE